MKSAPDFEEPGQEGFDTRVHIVDPKTGKLAKIQDYRLTVVGGRDRGIAVQVFERAGKFYWGNGEEATREEILKVIPDFPFSDAAKVITKKKTDEKSGLRTKRVVDTQELASS
jgi:hypothetical protein